MKIQKVIQVLEDWAPRDLQESYDNSGLLIGDPNTALKKCLITLDVTEDVVAEAKKKGCNLIVAHHPVIFKGLKRLNGKTFTERVVLAALRANVAIYAIHTNLDNTKTGVNAEIGRRLGVENMSILAPMSGKLYKLAVFVPLGSRDLVANTMFKAGAGWIGNYSHASFNSPGIGTFKGEEGSNPQHGEAGKVEEVEEIKVEVLVPESRLSGVLKAMKESHPYEEVAHDIFPIANSDQDRGAGMIGELARPQKLSNFLKKVKKSFNCGVIRFSGDLDAEISKVAWCGGSGSFLAAKAEAAGADIFLTGDIKYHNFFEPHKMVLADIGHYESEQFTKELIDAYLREKIRTFVPLLSEVNTNPVKYI